MNKQFLRRVRRNWKRGGYSWRRSKASVEETSKPLAREIECGQYVDSRGRNPWEKYCASSISVKIVDGVCRKGDCVQSCQYNRDFQAEKERRKRSKGMTEKDYERMRRAWFE